MLVKVWHADILGLELEHLLALRLLIVTIEDSRKGFVLSLLSSEVLIIGKNIRNILKLNFLLGPSPFIACQLDDRSLELMGVLIADKQRCRRNETIARLEDVFG